MSLWSQLVAHVATITAGIAVGSLALRTGSDAVLRLVAGLVAILAKDKRSRADRALDVICAIRGSTRAQRNSAGRVARNSTGRSLQGR